MLKAVSTKINQISHLIKTTQSPLPLVLDSLKIQPFEYVATSKENLKLRLRPRCGEWFTFYENIIRKDYINSHFQADEDYVIVDIGANIGAFSVLTGKLIEGHGKVYAFEPEPNTFKRLQENIQLNNLKNVEIFNEAVGGENGTLDFYVGKKSALNSSFAEVDGDSRAGESTKKISVSMRSIDSVLNLINKKINLLKMDCEGGEYLILESLTSERAQLIENIVMEIHTVPNYPPSWVPEKLQELGYKISGNYPLFAVRS
jgi:FkbM family methyltransferase